MKTLRELELEYQANQLSIENYELKKKALPESMLAMSEPGIVQGEMIQANDIMLTRRASVMTHFSDNPPQRHVILQASDRDGGIRHAYFVDRQMVPNTLLYSRMLERMHLDVMSLLARWIVNNPDKL